MNATKDIFIFSDYRLFLKEYYTVHKKIIKGFTLAIMAELAGFSSPSFIKHVIDGKRNLTKESTIKISRALRLSKPSAAYFEALVFFNQSTKLDEKLHFLHQLDQLRPKNAPHVLGSDQYRYLDKWYHPAIRELVDLPGFVENPQEIARNFIVPLKSDEVSKALLFLEENGFIHRAAKGKLTRAEKTIGVYATEHSTIMNTAMRQFHRSMLKFAERATVNLPVDIRSISNTTLSLSPKAYASAIRRIESLRLELLEIAKTDTDSNRIYHLTTALFPLTHCSNTAEPSEEISVAEEFA